ncbi:MAG: hypothetical protein ACR2QB_07685 [Gammaproteobacteria bacterium]
MSEEHLLPADDLTVEATGPGPFITRRIYRLKDRRQRIWQSRAHRKKLARAGAIKLLSFGTLVFRCLWNPRQLNWWIGVIFVLGATLFILGSLLFLIPTLAADWALDTHSINAVFFAGSIPFTTAAYLQLFQAANAGEFSVEGTDSVRETMFFGWQPLDIGWLSCALQFAGTLLFNLNTFDSMLPGLNWLQEDLIIWGPNFLGSLLFFAAGHLAFAEAGNSFLSWHPSGISWWVTFANLLGCLAFMISAFFAFVPPSPFGFDAATISVLFTAVGAAGFLCGSLLMLPETAASNY